MGHCDILDTVYIHSIEKSIAVKLLYSILLPELLQRYGAVQECKTVQHPNAGGKLDQASGYVDLAWQTKWNNLSLRVFEALLSDDERERRQADALYYRMKSKYGIPWEPYTESVKLLLGVPENWSLDEEIFDRTSKKVLSDPRLGSIMEWMEQNAIT